MPKRKGWTDPLVLPLQIVWADLGGPCVLIFAGMGYPDKFNLNQIDHEIVKSKSMLIMESFNHSIILPGLSMKAF